MNSDNSKTDSNISLLQLLGSVSLLPVQGLINQLVYGDGNAGPALRKFDNKVVAIECKSPDCNLIIHLQETRLQLSFLDERNSGLVADVTLSAKAADLLKLLTTKEQSRALANPDLAIQGDGQLLHELMQTLRSLDLDLGAKLAPFIGDTLSNSVERASEKGRGWSQEFKSRVDRNVTDYMQEEARLTPTRNEVNVFYEDLDALKLAVDRLAARISRAEAKNEGEATS